MYIHFNCICIYIYYVHVVQLLDVVYSILQLRISKVVEHVSTHLFIDTVVSAVTSGDRLQVIRGKTGLRYTFI